MSDLSFLPHPQWINQEAYPHPISKVVCVGRNYAAHAQELNNPIPSEPLLFCKTANAVTPLPGEIHWPSGRGCCHFEGEIALLIGQKLQGNLSLEQAQQAIIGLGLALDLTLRERQDQLKAAGHPWEVAKTWDASCPLSSFIPVTEDLRWDKLTLEVRINETIRQQGSSEQMLTPILPLVVFIAQHFTLYPGDVILTGTPAGVGELHPGDQIELRLNSALQVSAQVAPLK